MQPFHNPMRPTLLLLLALPLLSFGQSGAEKTLPAKAADIWANTKLSTLNFSDVSVTPAQNWNGSIDWRLIGTEAKWTFRIEGKEITLTGAELAALVKEAAKAKEKTDAN